MRVGVLHPGEMGASVAASLLASDHEVAWSSAGRSEHSRMRAVELQEFPQLDDLAAWAEVLISVCPPASALAQAQAVHACAFEGFYVDANAIAPATALEISQLMGAAFVDGGIIGPPAWQSGTTRMYLSGAHAATVAGWFQGGVLEVIALPEAANEVAASALKMAYAAYTKGHSALLLAVNALAHRSGVLDALRSEWAQSLPALSQRSEATAKAISPKAWRFAGEMEQISATFADCGLPPEFHIGAAELYVRLSEFKGQPPAGLDMLLDALAQADTSAQ
ncbi:MAG TPA: NAD(P)-dependent oxidoreductase [Gammaproteobacteria bacterium]|nr:NAD(P)-dependent oxidoreductase [Gammaproteobacteria bacterium]|tara:strand:+ start:178 stop:1014 length:837 start_codon:yes stop_codon:yes gene_type:complete